MPAYRTIGEEDEIMPAGSYSSYGAIVTSETTPLLEERMEGDPNIGIGMSTQTLVPLNHGPAKKLPQYIAAVSATIGAFALGTVLAWTSPTSTPLQDGKAGFPVSATEMSWVGALMTLGAAAVVIPMGWLIDKLGRKLTMLILVPPFVVGWALIVWASSVEMIFVGRFITGAAGGAFSLTAPVYTSEIAESSIRGTLGSLFQMMVVIGILFVYIVGSFVSIFWLSLICMIVPLVFGAVFFFMPETPLYRLQNARRNQAEDSLRFFRGKHYNIDAELQEMERAVEKAASEKTSFREAFSTKAAKKGLIIAFGLMIFQQLSGVNAVIFYTSTIFEAAGSDIDPNVSTIIVGAMQVLATFASLMIVDRLGRRILLLISDSIMAVCTLAIGIFFYLKKETDTDVSSIGWLPLVATCLFIIVFSLGFGPIPWMMVGEIFPPQIKGFASSLSCLVNWLLAFIVTKFYSDIELSFGTHTTFWIFTVISTVGTVFVYFVIPETKGKSLDEIQRELSGGKAPTDKPTDAEMPTKY